MDYYVKVNTICLMILAATAMTLGLSYTKVVLVPFVFSLFVYALMSPFIKWLRSKLRLPHLASIFLALLMFIIILVAFSFVVISSLEEFIKGADLYKERIFVLIQNTREYLEQMGIPLDKSIVKELRELPYLSFAKDISGWLLTFAANTTLVIIFIFFLALGERRPYVNGHPMVAEVQRKVFRYTSTKISVSFITGAVIGAVMFFFDLELALLLAIMTMLLNFIPNIGSIIATIMPLPVLFLQFGFSFPFYFILIFSGITQFTIGNIIEPKLMGDNLELHPITVLSFLVFWGLVWGMPGLFLAVPITAVMRMILARFELTYSIAELMSGRITTRKVFNRS